MDLSDVQFSDQEILHFAFVRGKDEKFRYELFENIKKIEENVNLQNVRKNAVVGAAHSHKICVLCCVSFTWRFRAMVCPVCYHSVCKMCMIKGTSCILCYNTRELEKQKKRWNFLFPYSQNSFIASKLNVPPFDYNFYSEFEEEERVGLNDYRNLFGWFTRNMIELKITELLDINIDESPIDKEPADTALCEITICLQEIINTFLSKCKYSDDEKVYYQLFKIVYEQQIADVCYDMQITIQHIIQTGRNLVFNSRNVNERRTYGNLLATAVVNKLVLNASNETPEPSLSVAIQTDDDNFYRHESDFKFAGPSPNSLTSRNIPADYDIDSALGADDRSSVNSSRFHNWFLKESARQSLFYGQPVVRSVKHFFVMPIHENNSLETQSSFSLRTPSSQDYDAKRAFLVKPHDVHCDSGQKAWFHCRVTDPNQSDVYWYHNNKEVRDKGRFRVVEKNNDCYLEIYDTTPSDSGDVICLVVNDTAVESERCVLKVKDYDVVGEDPYLEKSLENQVAVLGMKVVFQVVAHGYPEPRVTFYHNRSTVYNDDRRTIENNFGCWTLEINGILPTDAGEYIAITTNRMGRACSTAILHVLHRKFDEDKIQVNKKAQKFAASDDDQIVVLDIAPRKKHSSTSC